MYVSYSRVRPIFNRRTSWGGFHGSRYRRLWSLEEKEEEEEEEELQLQLSSQVGMRPREDKASRIGQPAQQSGNTMQPAADRWRTLGDTHLRRVQEYTHTDSLYVLISSCSFVSRTFAHPCLSSHVLPSALLDPKITSLSS